MKVQFLYHPENDTHVVSKILQSIKISPIYSLDGLRIKDIGPENEELFQAISNCDVLILFIGPTINRIVPIIWMNAIQKYKAVFGININSIPDEWDETRKKSANWNTEAFQGDKSLGNLCKTYALPEGEDGILYIKNNISSWCEEAIQHAKSGYGIT